MRARGTEDAEDAEDAGLASLRAVTAPVLLVRGADTLSGPGDGASQVAGALPNARLVTIAAAGHDPWLDQPGEFFAVVVRFLLLEGREGGEGRRGEPGRGSVPPRR